MMITDLKDAAAEEVVAAGIMDEANAERILDFVPDLDEGVIANMLSARSPRIFALRVVVDDTYSLRTSGDEPKVPEAFNAMVQELQGSPNAGEIWLSVIYMIRGEVLPPTRIAEVPRMVLGNATQEGELGYNADGSYTPLNRCSVEAIGSVLQLFGGLAAEGVELRSVVGIMSDGGNTDRSVSDQDACAALTAWDSKNHKVRALPVTDDARAAFLAMGLPETLMTKPGDLLAVMQEFSAFAYTASQMAAAGDGGK